MSKKRARKRAQHRRRPTADAPSPRPDSTATAARAAPGPASRRSALDVVAMVPASNGSIPDAAAVLSEDSAAPARLPAPTAPAPPSAGWRWRPPTAVPGRVADAIALGLVALAATALMAEAFLFGQVHYERDTYLFYYPVYQFFAAHLKQGQIPLWMPHLFSGYPLYADGETGMLYPLHWLFFGLLPTPAAFIALRWLHLVLAGAFMYAWMRVLGLRRLAALLAALTFAFSSFIVGQIHHENLVRTTVWLPLVLCWVEVAYRQRGRGRVLAVLAAGLTLGVQLLALHVQPALMTLIALALYAAFRTFWPPVGVDPPPRGWRERGHWAARRVGVSAAMTAGAVATGISLAMAQLWPLYELGIQTFRGVGAPFAFATTYSIHPTQLITLLFPYFFRGGAGGSWQLWAGWETLVYIGIAPLVLALVALAAARRREVAFFGFLALFGALLAFGDYSPLPLLELLWNLPGFSALRVPGRYSLLLVVALAVLAGYGLDWVERAARQGAMAPGQRSRGLLLAALGVNGSVLALLVAFVVARAWLEANQPQARALLEATYMALRRGFRELTTDAVYSGLLFSLDLGTRRTAFAFALLFAVGALLLLCWVAAHRAAVVRAALVALAAADLVLWARSFHPRQTLEALMAPPPAAQYLMQQQGGSLGRVWVSTDSLRELEYNRPAAWGLLQAGGYSSLEPQRQAEYSATVANTPAELLSLWDVRWIVEPARWRGLPVYKETSYYPGRPLLDAGAGNPAADVTFRIERPATDVRLIAALAYAEAIPQGARLGELVATTDRGEQIELPLLAGVHVSEWAIDRADVRARVRHARAEVAYTFTGREEGVGEYPQYYFYSAHPLPRREYIRSLRVRYRYGDGVLRVFGLALHDAALGTTHQVGPLDRSEYRPVYQDDRVRVYENEAAFGRAFVVHGAMLPRPSLPALYSMYMDPFDPRTEVLLDEPPPTDAWAPSAAPPVREVGVGTPPPPAQSTAQILQYTNERIVVRVNAERPGFLVLSDLYHPGWRARVDTAEAPVLRGDYLFRAVPVAAGEHTVELVYDPDSVRWGRVISLGALALVVALGMATWRAPALLWHWRDYVRPA